MSAAEAVLRGAAMVAGALEQARAQADAGARIDLNGLAMLVAEICSAAGEHRGGPQATAIQAALESLATTLGTLAETLIRQQEAMVAAAEGRPDRHTAIHRAAAAYGRGTPMAPKPAGPAAAPAVTPASPAPSPEKPS